MVNNDDLDFTVSGKSNAGVDDTDFQIDDSDFTVGGAPSAPPAGLNQPSEQRASIPLIDNDMLSEDINDLRIGFSVGANQLLKIGGQAYGLLTGNMDNGAIEVANENLAHYESKKSQGLLSSQEKLHTDVMEEEGIGSQAWAAFTGTLRDPALVGNFVTEQIPMLIATMGGSAVAGTAAKGAGLAATGINTARVAGGVGTGGLMQGSSVGGETHERLMGNDESLFAFHDQYKKLIAHGASEEQAKSEMALDLSRKTALAAGTISLLVQKIPGAKALERKLAGVSEDVQRGLVGRVVKAGLGEGVSEAIEEGTGQALQNLGVSNVDGSVNISDDVGMATGQGALGGGIAAGLAVPGPLRAPVAGNDKKAAAGENDQDATVDDFFGEEEAVDAAPVSPSKPSIIDPGLDFTIDAEVETSEQAAGRTATKPDDGSIDYDPDQPGGLSLAPKGTGADGSKLATELSQQETNLYGQLGIESSDQAAQRLASRSSQRVPVIDADGGISMDQDVELESSEQAEQRIADQAARPVPEIPRTPEVLSSQKFTRAANRYADLAEAETDPEVQNQLIGLAEIALKKAQGKQPKMTRSQRLAMIRVIDPGKDTIDIALRKLGGLDIDLETDFDGRLKHLDANDKRVGLPRIERKGGKGLSLDAATEQLMQDGYIDSFDQSILADKLERAAGGEKIYSNAVDLDALHARDFQQEQDDAEFEEAVRLANIPGLPSIVTRLRSLGVETAEIDQLLGELRTDGLTSKEIAGGLEKMADDIAERESSQTASDDAQSGSSNESKQGRDVQPTNEPSDSGDGGSGSRQRPEQNRGNDGQDVNAELSLRQGENSNGRQHEVDATNGTGLGQISGTRKADEQPGSEPDGNEQEVDSVDGQGLGQSSGTRNADEQPGSQEGANQREVEPIGNEQLDATSDENTAGMPLLSDISPDAEVDPVIENDEFIFEADAGSVVDEFVSTRESLVESINSGTFDPDAHQAYQTARSALITTYNAWVEDNQGNQTPAEAAADADPNPTPKQAKAGNYKKGHVKLLGYDVSIETAKGSDRVGTDADGKEIWRNTMGGHYGHLLGTKGADGDQLDVFIGDGKAADLPVYVMNQKKINGKGFDEHKLFMAFDSITDARKAYDDSYPAGWKAGARLNKINVDQLQSWIANGDTTQAFDKSALIKSMDESIAKPAEPVEQTEQEVKAAMNDKKDYKLTDEMRSRMSTESAPAPTRQKASYYIGVGQSGSLMTLRHRYMDYNFNGRMQEFDHYIGTLGLDFERSIAKAFSKIPDGYTLYRAVPGGTGVRNKSVIPADVLRFGKYEGKSFQEIIDSGDAGYLAWLAGKGKSYVENQPNKFKKAFAELIANNESIAKVIAADQAKVDAKIAADKRADANALETEAKQKWLIDALEVVSDAWDSNFAFDMARKLRKQPFNDMTDRMRSAIIKSITKLDTNNARVNTKKYKDRYKELMDRAVAFADPNAETDFDDGADEAMNDSDRLDNEMIKHGDFKGQSVIAMSDDLDNGGVDNLIKLATTDRAIVDKHDADFIKVFDDITQNNDVISTAIELFNRKPIVPSDDNGAIGSSLGKNTTVSPDLLEVSSVEVISLLADFARRKPIQYGDGTISVDGVPLFNNITGTPTASTLTHELGRVLQAKLQDEGVTVQTNPELMTRNEFVVANHFSNLLGDFEIDSSDFGGVLKTGVNGGFMVDNDALYDKIQKQRKEREAKKPLEKPARKKLGKPADKPADKPVSKAGKIDDFGEKIGGSRKDNYGLYGKGFDGEVDYDKSTLANVLPKIDYQAMLDNGVTRSNVSLLAWMKKDLGAKPRGKYQNGSRERWTLQAKKYRSIMQDIIEGNNSDKLIDVAIDAKNDIRWLDQNLPENLDTAADYKILQMEQVTPTADIPKGTKIYIPYKKTGGRGFVNSQGIRELTELNAIAKGVEMINGLVSGKKAKRKSGATGAGRKPIELGVYRTRGSRKVKIGFKRIGNFITVKDGFDTSKEASDYLKANIDELNAQVEAKREPPRLRREQNAERIGPPRRNGDVSAETFGDFNFYGVEFGTWVDNESRQGNLNQAYDALMDLAEGIGFNPSALSLNNSLGLAFGARGKGGNAAAHFEPSAIAINLTKKHGAGSLAHEWLHAIDNHLSRLNDGIIDGRVPSMVFLTDAKETNNVRPELHDAWRDVVKTINATDLKKRSDDQDTYRNKKYFGTDIELMARSFETWITKELADKGISNDYLANIYKEGDIYPTDQEMQTIGPAFKKLFKLIEQEKTESGYRIKEEIGALQSVESKRSSYRKTDKQTEMPFAVPTSEEAHADPIGMSERSVRNLRRHPFSILANGLTKDFVDRSSTSLIGQNIRSAEDLAIAAQVYRNPAFETLRIIVVDANGDIHSTNGLTSRLPGAVSFTLRRLNQIATAGLDAAGPGSKFYLQHNHPSGDSQPSMADQEVTEIYGRNYRDKFAGHVVINNQTYSVIDGKGKITIDRAALDVDSQYTAGQNPTIDHPLLGQNVFSVGGIASVAKSLEGNNHPVLIQLSTGNLSGIVEFPIDSLVGMSDVKVLALFKQAMQATGSNQATIANLPKDMSDAQSKRLHKLLVKAAGLDIIAMALDTDGKDILHRSLYPSRGRSGGESGRANEKNYAVRARVDDLKEPNGPQDGDAYDAGVVKRLLKRAKKQPIDTVFMAPFETARVLGNKTGVTPQVKRQAARAVGAMEDFYADKMGFAHPSMRAAGALFIDRYGLTEEYIKRDQSRKNQERVIQLTAMELITELKNIGVNDVKSAKALQEILVNENAAPRHLEKMSKKIRDQITELGERALALDMISQESFDRNKAAYLHRVYMKYEATDNNANGIGAKFLKNRRMKIMGNAFKGRGLFQKVSNKRIKKDLADDTILAKGDKLKMIDYVAEEEDSPMPSGNQRVRRRMYIPADQEPEIIDGWIAKDRGTFDVRETSTSGVTLWRDYSKAERTTMGEITDARYTLIRTMQILSSDITTGEFYKDIAEHPEWTYQEEGEPDDVVDGSDLMLKAYRPLTGVEWVRVPDAIISKTGGRRKYGALAGKYIRSEVFRDIMAVEEMMTPNWYSKLMSQWKLNKTARNPVTHLNNVMSNVILADIADVRADHLLGALQSWKNKDQDYLNANAMGAFGGSFLEGEIKREILDPIIKELQGELLAEAPKGQTGGTMQLISAMQKISGGVVRAVQAADSKMQSTYQLEDEIFRLATYIKFIEDGKAPEDAAIDARDQFLNYDIRAPGVNALRKTILPFAAYTYRAAPVLTKSIAQRPWKLAKYFTMTYAFNAIAYALTGADEDEERRSLRDNEQGLSWIGAPRMMRMPWDDDNDNGVFLDIRRWIPAGDIFDLAQGESALPLPAPLLPGGPLAIPFEILLNKQGFTGQEIVNMQVDDNSTRIKKVADYLWKTWMPSNIVVPGSWYQEKIYNAATGATDRQGREYSVAQAVLSSFGIKLKPQDVSYNMANKAREFSWIQRSIQVEMTRNERAWSRGTISESKYLSERKRFTDKMVSLAEKAQKVFSPQ